MDEGTRTLDDRNHNPGLYQLSYTHHKSIYCTKALFGAPGRIRTSDPRLRRPLLYPAELRALGESSLQKVVGETGFEPATPCTQNKCATKLRHSPTGMLTLSRRKSLKIWCGRRDLNSHAVKHWNLNPACLPIPPLPRKIGVDDGT